MDNLSALKALYTAIGGDSADVLSATTNLDVLNGIATKLGASTGGTDIASAITAISAVAGGQIKKLTTKSVDPTTENKTYTPSSTYNGFSSFTVKAVTAAIDENITAGNIKSGVTILGVEGTYDGT